MSDSSKFAADRFPVKPVCELCKTMVATGFVSTESDPEGKRTGWVFCCACTDFEDEHIVIIDDFFDNPASTAEEIAELHKYGNDWENFMAMMVRFQEATQSYNQ